MVKIRIQKTWHSDYEIIIEPGFIDCKRLSFIFIRYINVMASNGQTY